MSDYTSLTRSEWLNRAEAFYSALNNDLDSFDSKTWNRTTPYFGWRARDVLAHMTSAMPVNFRQVLDRALEGNPEPPPEFNTFARNAREVAKRRTMPMRQLLGEFHSELESILRIYRQLSDADWLKPAWLFVGAVNIRSIFLVQMGDHLLHKRDLMLVAGRWQGFDAPLAEPLIDWFLRELRTANFRPDTAVGLRATVQYTLSGVGGGAWVLRIDDGRCEVQRGAIAHPDIEIKADTEDLIAAAQARPAPIIGRFARRLDWIRGRERREDTVASLTGQAGLVTAVLTKRIQISGDRALVGKLNHAFWHFGQRTQQTEENIHWPHLTLSAL